MGRGMVGRERSPGWAWHWGDGEGAGVGWDRAEGGRCKWKITCIAAVSCLRVCPRATSWCSPGAASSDACIIISTQINEDRKRVP